MTDLVCFRVAEGFKERIIVALERDFYNTKNQFAVGSPVVVPDKDGFVLFLCPVILPVGGFVGRIVKDTVFKGFKSSFAKANISISRVKSSSKLVSLYDEGGVKLV